MNRLMLRSPCYNIQKYAGGFWTSTNRSIHHLDNMGKIIDRYSINNPDGFCYNAPTNEIGVLDTSGRFFLIDTDTKKIRMIDTEVQYESNHPILIGNCMLWVQWNGVVRLYDFAKQKLKCVAVLGNGVRVHARGYTFDSIKNKIYILFSYPPKLQTSLASIDLVSGGVLIYRFPFRYPKEIDRICIYNGNYLCLRTTRPSLFLISSEDFSVLEKINLRANLWTAYDFFWDAPRKDVYIWNDSLVLKVNMQNLTQQIIWEDEYISDVSVAENGDICIGTWKKGIVFSG